METLEKRGLAARLRETISQGTCPECGSVMRESDRVDDGHVLYVWYECARTDCDGQWLKKQTKNKAG